MNLGLLDIFNLIGIIHGFILAIIVLYSKFFRSKTNSYLGITLLLISIVGINNWFWDLGENPLLIAILDIFLWQFLYPVILFFYFVKATDNELHTRNKLYLFLPFIILSTINLIIVLQNIFFLYKLPFLTQQIIRVFYKGIYFLSFIFPIIMMVISAKYVFNKNNVKDVIWIRSIWIAMFILIIFGSVLELIRFITSNRVSMTYLWMLVTIFTYWLIFKGFYKFRLSNERFELKIQVANSPSKIKSSTRYLDDYINKLHELIIDQKMYQDPNISREKVADLLGISSGYLSSLISQTSYSNFSEFINHYRVEAIKQMIINPDFEKYSLLAIGLEAGFSSKATYYNVFKKRTGMTPNQYRKFNT